MSVIRERETVSSKTTEKPKAPSSPLNFSHLGAMIAHQMKSAPAAAKPAAPKPVSAPASSSDLGSKLSQSRPAARATGMVASGGSTWGMAAKYAKGDSGVETVRSAGQVAEVLDDNVSALDSAAGGRQDGKFGSQDLEQVANDPNASQELREAAQQVLDDPNLYHALDLGNGSSLDDTISSGDLTRVMEAQGPNSGDKPTMDQVANQFHDHFDALDSAKNGKTDGIVSREDLAIAAQDSSRPQEERDLAQLMLDDSTYWDAFDVAADGGSKDGKVSSDDLTAARYAPSVDKVDRDTWSSSDEAALDRALNDPKFGEGDLFAGFSQTDRGNCVSTAIIKGAIDHYGSGVFDEVKKSEDGGYTVKLQDGNSVSVTREELEAATAGSHYEGSEPETQAFANLTYAVMAKRAQELGHEGSHTFGEALVSLANGENPEQTPEFLGLQDRMQSVSIDDVRGMDGVVTWGDGHALDVDTLDGQTYGDAWGDRRVFDGTNYVGSENGVEKVGHLKNAYIFN